MSAPEGPPRTEAFASVISNEVPKSKKINVERNKESSATKPDIGLPIVVLIIFGLLGGVIAGLSSDRFNASYYGVLVGVFVGLALLMTIEYASQSFRKQRRMLLLISLMLAGVFSLATPVHADAVLGWQFAPGGLNAATTEPCQSLLVQTQWMNECAGLAGRMWKDTSEQDSNYDNYLVEMRVFAMNGTNEDCFETNYPCNYPIVATSIYNARIGIILNSPGNVGLWGYGPGPGCTNTETPVSLSYSGVGLDFLMPAMCTSWNSSPNYNWNITIADSCWPNAPYCYPNVFSRNGGYASFYVEFNVPESASFTVTFNARLTLTYCKIQNYCWGVAGSNVVYDGNAGYNLSADLYTDPSATPCFTLGVAPSSLGTYPSATVSTEVDIYSNSTCAGAVALQAVFMIQGTTMWFSPVPVNISPGEHAVSTLWIHTASAPVGTYYVNVIGRYGGSIGSTNVLLTLTIYPNQSGGGGGGGRVV